MARLATPVAFLATAALIALSAPSVDAQRPALSGEKARVADAVKRDLSRLATLQRTYRGRARTFAADPKLLNFTPTSGAEVSIAFASANAWAANASHATLAPVKCFVIVSAADAADAPTSQPFCTDADPNTAAGRVAAAGNAPAEINAPSSAPTTRTTPPVSQPQTKRAEPQATEKKISQPRTTSPAGTRERISLPTNTPSTRTPPANTPPAAAPATRADPAGIRMITRDASETALADRVEPVSAADFSGALAAMAREAVTVMDAPPPQLVRDPYESTQEFEARKATAMAEYQAREAEWFRSTRRSFVVTLPVRNVRYDADAEVLEFGVDALRLPNRREGRSQLTVACFTRPVFWCTPDAGLSYDATDIWKVPRATARQFDVLRAPMTLTARFTVGGRTDSERALSISLVDLELQARGQVVQRWTGR